MKLNTARFGEYEYRQEDVLTFPKGIFGFPDEKEFLLLTQFSEEPFMWLQSVHSPQLAFVLLDPWVVMSEYKIDLSEDVKRALKIVSKDQVMVMGIVVIPDDPKLMTINLRAPIVMNVKDRLAEQVILPDDLYPIRYKIFSE